MLRFPFRQVFGDPDVAPTQLADVFVPKLSFQFMHRTFQAGIDNG